MPEEPDDLDGPFPRSGTVGTRTNGFLRLPGMGMMTGAMFGAIFGVALTRLPAMATLPRVAVGAAYGVVAFAASTFVLLPLASHVANDSNAIDTMAKIVGYPTFLAEHVLFGAVLGLLSVSRAARPATERSKVTAA